MITCFNVFNVQPKTTILLPVWPRDVKRLDTSGRQPPRRWRLWLRPGGPVERELSQGVEDGVPTGLAITHTEAHKLG